MRSRSLSRRLDAVRFPKSHVDFTVLHPIEQHNYWEILLAIKDRTASEFQINYFLQMYSKCPLISNNAFLLRLRRWYLDEDLRVKRAFSVVFQNFALINGCVAVPSRCNRLSLWNRQIAYRVFGENGWVIGESDCSGIRFLEHWTSAHREFVIDLYQRAQPALGRFPPGWVSKFDPRLPFR